MSEITLCAIVRDEAENPLGGIARWLEHHLSLFSDAVIIDTGSEDETPQILDEYRDTDLVTDRIVFEDFAQARNHALRLVRTPYAFVLDADEIVPGSTFEKLPELVRWGYGFPFDFLYTDGSVERFWEGMLNPRLFRAEYRILAPTTGWGEYVDGPIDETNFGHPIVHVLPGREANRAKREHWYRSGAVLRESALDHKTRHGWAQRNPYADACFDTSPLPRARLVL